MIIPGSIRDFTYIASNMRPADWREIACQCPDDVRPLDVAVWSLAGREAWTAVCRGQPAAAFGAHPATTAGNVLSAWAWGTPSMRRVVPEITRFIRETRAPEWIKAGVTRVEVRSISGHDAAHRWLRSLGWQEEPLREWGKGGEEFVLFWFTRERWLRTQRPQRKSARTGVQESEPKTIRE